jgi:hypothetical protein
MEPPLFLTAIVAVYCVGMLMGGIKDEEVKTGATLGPAAVLVFFWILFFGSLLK